MANLFSFGLNILADVFYPKYCFDCRRAGGYLCKFCVLQVPYLTKTFCVVCNTISPRGNTHSACKTTTTADRLICAIPYQYPVVSDMIITGKYYFIPEIFAVLGALSAHIVLQNHIDVPEEDFKDFVICPIPLHTQRLKWRGFNQSIVTGKIIAQAFNIPIANILIRSKKTKTQKDLTSVARSKNMNNAFACQYQPPRKVILIDDVTTTGSTFLDAARALKEEGAEIVWCISIAKD